MLSLPNASGGMDYRENLLTAAAIRASYGSPLKYLLWSKVLVSSVIPAARYKAHATTWNRISKDVRERREDEVKDQQEETSSKKVHSKHPNAVSRKYIS